MRRRRMLDTLAWTGLTYCRSPDRRRGTRTAAMATHGPNGPARKRRASSRYGECPQSLAFQTTTALRCLSASGGLCLRRPPDSSRRFLHFWAGWIPRLAIASSHNLPVRAPSSRGTLALNGFVLRKFSFQRTQPSSEQWSPISLQGGQPSQCASRVASELHGDGEIPQASIGGLLGPPVTIREPRVSLVLSRVASGLYDSVV